MTITQQARRYCNAHAEAGDEYVAESEFQAFIAGAQVGMRYARRWHDKDERPDPTTTADKYSNYCVAVLTDGRITLARFNFKKRKWTIGNIRRWCEININ